MQTIILTLTVSFILTALLTGLLLPLLKRLKMGQSILKIGPSWHLSKQGTPTMGGIAFLISFGLVVLSLSLFFRWSTRLVLVLIYGILNGIIGISDDLIKIKRKHNEGLSAFAKFLFQLLAAGIFLVLLAKFDVISEEIYIPFLKNRIYVGRLWYPFALLMLVGFTNAVNLTDGLDGLCSSVSGAVGLGLTLLSVTLGEYAGGIIGAFVIGCAAGFLIYNFHPAKVFMGDTGSLFLGAVITSAFLVSYKNTAVLIIGAVYLFEALSVILQVLYYKATKKRLFLMAPFHHHLEKKGYSEVKITLFMTAITLALALASYLYI